jgi:hypothetical protein
MHAEKSDIKSPTQTCVGMLRSPAYFIFTKKVQATYYDKLGARQFWTAKFSCDYSDVSIRNN